MIFFFGCFKHMSMLKAVGSSSVMRAGAEDRNTGVVLSRQESCSTGPMKSSIAAAVGTIQVMVGLFNIGLGSGRTSTRPGDVSGLGAAYWLGAVFIVTGIMSVLAGQFPSSCLVGFTVFMNIIGSIFAITAIVLYSVDMKNASLLWMCDDSNSVAVSHNDGCRNVALLVQSLLTSMDTALIVLAALLLFVSVRFAVLGIRALSR